LRSNSLRFRPFVKNFEPSYFRVFVFFCYILPCNLIEHLTVDYYSMAICSRHSALSRCHFSRQTPKLKTRTTHSLVNSIPAAALTRITIYLRVFFYLCIVSNAVVLCAIIACNALQFLHAIIAGFQTCWKIFMRQKYCS